MKHNKFARDYERMTGEKYSLSLISFVRVCGRHYLRYMFLFRKFEKRKRFDLRFLMYLITRKFGIEISPYAEIGEGLYLGHPYNITVGSDVKIGRNCSLHKGCTIGRENRGKRIGSPVLGDNVWVGINVTVVGGVTIGNDVMIAPNTFVNFDVPDHSVVIGSSATIHHRDNATEGYIL